jgi:hypothetical protein
MIARDAWCPFFAGKFCFGKKKDTWRAGKLL